MATEYRFSFGPWNLHEGADPFGPPVRPSRSLEEKMGIAQKLGFHALQFHDDDVVPADAAPEPMRQRCREVKRMLEDHGLAAEFIAPRLWEDPRTIDGAVTSNNAAERQYAVDRSRRACDIAREMGTRDLVWWPAREGTYIRESKDPRVALDRMLEYANALLTHDTEIRILGEMKPNEPMDLTFCPTTGHFVGLCYRTIDPSRAGVLIESAHALLAGLDPSEEFAYALWHNKLWSVHLNDQDGLKYDQDKAFGVVNLRRAFNQVDVLERHGYGSNGEYVGLDVKAFRTQPHAIADKHLSNSMALFHALVEVSRTIDRQEWSSYVEARDYEGLEWFILRNLMKLR
jgi:xylose isomerase